MLNSGRNELLSYPFDLEFFMCGIFGCIQEIGAAEVCLEGLKRLEYRGYDSAGLAGIVDGQIDSIRRVGRVSALEEAFHDLKNRGGAFIAHTRWATHGAIVERNAHPICSPQGRFACVHNGIIENCLNLKRALEAKGRQFATETDTETIVQLAEQVDSGDLVQTVFEVAGHLKGRSSFALIDAEHPDVIVAVALGSSLSVGIGVGVTALSSDIHAFGKEIERTFVIPMGHVVYLSQNGFHVYNQLREKIVVHTDPFHSETMQSDRGDHAHFMFKEILEQPDVLRQALVGRRSLYDWLGARPTNLVILGCGTSWHAGGIASCWFEEVLRIPTRVYIASEFRYGPILMPEGAVVLAISQSGETADTLAAAEAAKAAGARVLAISNTTSSSLARLSDMSLSLQAGPEIGVASTKTYTATLALMWSLMGQGDAALLPSQMQETLELAPKIEELAERWSHFNQMLFIGRGTMLWTAREAALKLKELAYIHASAYAAGELKHGPIALIDEECPTVIFCSEEASAPKIASTIMEIQARSGPTLLIAPERVASYFEGIKTPALFFPSSVSVFDPIVATGVAQLFAYFIARARGCAIDQPRNLAKSVTVE